MELIDRYVAAVGRRLPRAKRDEIERELRSALLDTLEGEGADAVDEEAVVRVLRRLGRPEEVALSYHPAGGYLIGPETFPTFQRVTAAVLLALAGLVTAAFALSVAVRTPEATELARRFGGLATGLTETLFTAFGILVLIFAFVDRADIRSPKRSEDWDPRTLPAIRPGDEIPRFDAVMAFVAPAAVFVLVNLFRDQLGLWILPRGELLLHDLALEILPWLNVALLAGMFLGLAQIGSGRWHWSTRVAKLGVDLFGLYVFWRLSRGLVARRGELLGAGLPERLVDLLELATRLGIAVVAIAILWGVARLLYRRARLQPNRPVM